MLILASVPYFLASARWFIKPGFIPEKMGGGQVWPWLGLVIMIPFWSPLITGATCALFRKACGLAFAGAMTPLVLTMLLRPWGWGDAGIGYLMQSSPFGIYLLCTVLFNCVLGGAAVLLWYSRQEFTDRQPASGWLYSPPQRIRDLISRYRAE